MKVAQEWITQNCHFSNYFYKIMLNFTNCGCLSSVVRFLAVLKPQSPRFDAGPANNVYWMLLTNNLGSWCEDKHKCNKYLYTLFAINSVFRHFPWPWPFRRPDQVHGHFAQPWPFIYYLWKWPFLSGCWWYEFSVMGGETLVKHREPLVKYL